MNDIVRCSNKNCGLITDKKQANITNLHCPRCDRDSCLQVKPGETEKPKSGAQLIALERNRQMLIEGWSPGQPVMMMSLRSGAGLDGLQEACSTIVHGELDWSPGVHEQCRGRLFRDGQKNPVQEFYLVSEGGSDPVIAEILGLKASQVRGLLDPDDRGLKKMQTDIGARVKRMAEAYLRRGKK